MAAANFCGGGRKSSSKTGEPGESRSSLTVKGSAGMRCCCCLGRPPPKASLKVHQVAKTSGGTLFRRIGRSGVELLAAGAEPPLVVELLVTVVAVVAGPVVVVALCLWTWGVVVEIW